MLIFKRFLLFKATVLVKGWAWASPSFCRSTATLTCGVLPAIQRKHTVQSTVVLQLTVVSYFCHGIRDRLIAFHKGLDGGGNFKRDFVHYRVRPIQNHPQN